MPLCACLFSLGTRSQNLPPLPGLKGSGRVNEVMSVSCLPGGRKWQDRHKAALSSGAGRAVAMKLLAWGNVSKASEAALGILRGSGGSHQIQLPRLRDRSSNPSSAASQL